ncbi:hypothetical protein BDW22DRAFT_1321064 [Trametopsis cervina]|nr:hypothetical protein BDW22DRAFT_1321064 [Trametopsis cervina]
MATAKVLHTVPSIKHETVDRLTTSVTSSAPPSFTTVSVHPSFNDPHADIALCSHDQTIFRVHSLILSHASGWFRTLFSLPQCLPTYKPSASPETIHLLESSQVIAGLLSIATGLPLPPLDSYAYVEDLLRGAEKYDMPSVLSVVRLAIMSPPLLEAHPIRVYGIACSWGWTAEAKIASTKTIGHDLLAPSALADLRTVDAPYLTRLMLLHRQRRDAFRAGLDSPVLFYANAPGGGAKCTACRRDVTHVRWTELKHAWARAIEQCPADVASKAVLGRSEVHRMLEATCEGCHGKLYDTEGTVAKLRELLDRLPSVVDL